MIALARQFALFFYVGFIAVFAALAYSLMTTGDLFAAHPFLAALRAFGLGVMAAGMVLWIALRRSQGGKTALNPLFGFLLFAGGVLLALGLLFPFSGLSQPASLGGLAFMGAGLLIGLLVMLFSPALPEPAAKRWPEEAKTVLTKFAREEDETPGHAEEAEHEADDLTRIEGIGPQIQTILHAAGIDRFEVLAASSPEEITAILKAAGFRAPFNPETWPRQAEMAAQGEWGMLRALQDGLVAGRVD